MNILQYAKDIKKWAGDQNYTINPYKINKNKPADNLLYKIKKYHPELLKLYVSCNGALVAWENAVGDICGLLKILTSKDLILMIESEIKLMSGFDDNYIINSGYNKVWWLENIKIYRSLIKFYDEGNGDGIFISKENEKIYFLFHNWMDWVGKEPPIIELSASMDQLIEEWSKINFSKPKNLYWMSAINNGKFIGFNEDGFMVNK